MAIYTRFGDLGKTSLQGGVAVSKDDPRVVAYGSVDELNAMLGLVVAFSDDASVKSSMLKIQKDLFVIGSYLSSSGNKKRPFSIAPSRISEIESEIDGMEADMPPLHHFLIPGGCKIASLLHLSRTVCRRAERDIVALSKKSRIDNDVLTYMNRVGDLLFIRARYANYRKRIPEAIWKGKKSPL